MPLEELGRSLRELRFRRHRTASEEFYRILQRLLSPTHELLCLVSMTNPQIKSPLLTIVPTLQRRKAQRSFRNRDSLAFTTTDPSDEVVAHTGIGSMGDTEHSHDDLGGSAETIHLHRMYLHRANEPRTALESLRPAAIGAHELMLQNRGCRRHSAEGSEHRPRPCTLPHLETWCSCPTPGRPGSSGRNPG